MPPRTQPATPPPTRLSPRFCAERAASLLEEAEKSSDAGAVRNAAIAAGWRDLGVALSQILAARN